MHLVFPESRIVHLDEVTSTNPVLQELSTREKLPEGSIVITDRQTQGRGQGNNYWESEPFKNLTFSILLYPRNMKASDQFLLSKVISLSVHDFISQHVDDVWVKWPNDVYVGNKKITGILIENFIESGYINKSIAGIGININQEVFHSDASNPVSLIQLTGHSLDLDTCLSDLMDCIRTRYRMLTDGWTSILNSDYLRYLYRFGQLSRFSVDGEIFEAYITGVNKYGMLEMITMKNEHKLFGFKEVNFED